MRHKAMQLVLGMLARCRKFSSVLEAVFWVPLPRFGNEIRWCFAVADASQSHAACAWQARWLQDTFLEFLCYVLGTKLGVVFCCCGCLTKPSRPNLRRRRRPSPVESRRARKTGGGAVRHRRQDGEVGTWTCPDCRRVIRTNI